MIAANKQLVRGSDATLTIVVRTSSGDPLDLETASEITVRLKKADKTALSKTLSSGSVTVVNAHHGRVVVEVNETESAALLAAQNAPIEVVVDFGTIRRIAQIKTGLNIVDRLF